MSQKAIILSLIKFVVLTILVAYGVIVLLVYSIPHFPLANRRTFHTMLRAQTALDREHESTAEARNKGHILLLGSSVVERGVDDSYLDSSLAQHGLLYYTTNAGAGGFFAKANLVMFRAMLERGLHPARVIYGIFLQELNGKSAIHSNLSDEDTSSIKLKQKSLWNVIRYGPAALSPMLDGSGIHIYLFAYNNAFRDVHDPNFFQRLSFGENLFEKDSSYVMNPDYLRDLEEIYQLCKERNIPFSFFNAPVRPKVVSLADLPYLHRQEAYHAVEQFALNENIPIWNFDKPGAFENEDFLDTYHLSPNGARKLTEMLSNKITDWQRGLIEQDVTSPSPYSRGAEVQDSLVRSVFHF
ncbi:MAG: hypothetical protein Q8916_14810 [Bacteroidota bacterium]|nr:hypothetical protein [Bacteroidota bacterium]MDP4231667.1 hypothetical protein [Bacteroidota bacterium]MDP4235899.1 hypothetical protein [Bacteroidota bacterium]